MTRVNEDNVEYYRYTGPARLNKAVHELCALSPEVLFEGNIFCLTGTSSRAPRREIERIIVDRGGVFSRNVTQKVNYLVVGCEGNACWAFSCYGRKVEEAMTLRKSGHKIAIIHEVDFWDHVV